MKWVEREYTNKNGTKVIQRRRVSDDYVPITKKTFDKTGGYARPFVERFMPEPSRWSQYGRGMLPAAAAAIPMALAGGRQGAAQAAQALGQSAANVAAARIEHFNPESARHARRATGIVTGVQRGSQALREELARGAGAGNALRAAGLAGAQGSGEGWLGAAPGGRGLARALGGFLAGWARPRDHWYQRIGPALSNASRAFLDDTNVGGDIQNLATRHTAREYNNGRYGQAAYRHPFNPQQPPREDRGVNPIEREDDVDFDDTEPGIPPVARDEGGRPMGVAPQADEYEEGRAAQQSVYDEEQARYAEEFARAEAEYREQLEREQSGAEQEEGGQQRQNADKEEKPQQQAQPQRQPAAAAPPAAAPPAAPQQPQRPPAAPQQQAQPQRPPQPQPQPQRQMTGAAPQFSQEPQPQPQPQPAMAQAQTQTSQSQSPLVPQLPSIPIAQPMPQPAAAEPRRNLWIDEPDGNFEIPQDDTNISFSQKPFRQWSREAGRSQIGVDTERAAPPTLSSSVLADYGPTPPPKRRLERFSIPARSHYMSRPEIPPPELSFSQHAELFGEEPRIPPLSFQRMGGYSTKPSLKSAVSVQADEGKPPVRRGIKSAEIFSERPAPKIPLEMGLGPSFEEGWANKPLNFYNPPPSDILKPSRAALHIAHAGASHFPEDRRKRGLTVEPSGVGEIPYEVPPFAISEGEALLEREEEEKRPLEMGGQKGVHRDWDPNELSQYRDPSITIAPKKPALSVQRGHPITQRPAAKARLEGSEPLALASQPLEREELRPQMSGESVEIPETAAKKRLNFSRQMYGFERPPEILRKKKLAVPMLTAMGRSPRLQHGNTRILEGKGGNRVFIERPDIQQLGISAGESMRSYERPEIEQREDIVPRPLPIYAPAPPPPAALPPQPAPAPRPPDLNDPQYIRQRTDEIVNAIFNDETLSPLQLDTMEKELEIYVKNMPLMKDNTAAGQIQRRAKELQLESPEDRPFVKAHMPTAFYLEHPENKGDFKQDITPFIESQGYWQRAKFPETPENSVFADRAYGKGRKALYYRSPFGPVRAYWNPAKKKDEYTHLYNTDQAYGGALKRLALTIKKIRVNDASDPYWREGKEIYERLPRIDRGIRYHKQTRVKKHAAFFQNMAKEMRSAITDDAATTEYIDKLLEHARMHYLTMPLKYRVAQIGVKKGEHPNETDTLAEMYRDIEDAHLVASKQKGRDVSMDTSRGAMTTGLMAGWQNPSSRPENVDKGLRQPIDSSHPLYLYDKNEVRPGKAVTMVVSALPAALASWATAPIRTSKQYIDSWIKAKPVTKRGLLDYYQQKYELI